MTRTDWNVSIYAGAAWGGAFWAGLRIILLMSVPNPPPHAVPTAVAVSVVVGIGGLLLFRAASGVIFRRAGAAVSIGAFIGLPVLAWFALW